MPSQPSSLQKKIPALKRTFSNSKFILKAKQTTKSLLQQVLFTKTMSETHLPLVVTIDSKPHVFEPSPKTQPRHHSLRSLHKRLSSKRRKKLEDASEGVSSNATVTSTFMQHKQEEIAAAEADILSGIERPGSVALACDYHTANEKQSTEFHELFKSVPEHDVLIECYTCAYQKHILHQGRLYVSEHYVCFKSNIFGVVTNLVINYAEILRVEKRMTAKIIPNGIIITTNVATHIFASFLARDQAYDQIVKIWDLNKRANSAHRSPSSDSREDGGSTISPPILITDHDNPIIHRKPPAYDTNNILPLNDNIKNRYRPRSSLDKLDMTPRAYNLSKLTKYNVQPSIFEKIPKVCSCVINGDHYCHVALNETFSGTVESMSHLLFKSSFIKTFLERYESFEDIQLSDWKHGSRLVTGKRKIKSSTTGTRVVDFQFEDKKIHQRLPYFYCVSSKKSMPNIPIGSVYHIETKTCIRRISKRKVNIMITFHIVFSKNSLVSSIIENNAADDQFRLYRHLKTVLEKPEILRELVEDDSILQDFQLVHISLSSQKIWTRIQAIHWVYVIIFAVIATHCVLALRLRRISYQLSTVSHNTNVDPWEANRLHWIQSQYRQLKDETEDLNGLLSKPKTHLK